MNGTAHSGTESTSRRRTSRLLVGALVSMLAAAGAVVSTAGTAAAATADPVPGFIGANASWLATVNYYRAMAGLGPVSENPTYSAGAAKHSCYMLYNDITHYETVGLPGYTAEGAAAGVKSNVSVSTVINTSARSHVELWMSGPFHAIGVLRHSLRNVGFGKCDLSTTAKWHSGATLNILDGLDRTAVRPSTPILFPGNGTTTNLYKFIAESPNPVTACGWTGEAGLPVIAMMPEAVSSVSATMTGPNGPIETCPLFAGNLGRLDNPSTTVDESASAKSILASENAVTVLPRTALTPGTYTVTVTTQARTVTWSFTVDPAAANGTMPLPQVVAAGQPTAFTPVTPFRLADSRIPLRITSLTANVPVRIKVAGVESVPQNATAVSANFTITAPRANGFITVYDCAANVPTASTLNFKATQTVANAGTFTLNSAGELCVYSIASTHLIIDINGYFGPEGTMGYTPMTATPVIDTTTLLNGVARLTAGQTVRAVVGKAGVPAGATAVALNITTLNTASGGFITAYPCGMALPAVSNVNVAVGAARQNLAVVPVSANGEVCIYSYPATDLKVDVLGYYSSNGVARLTPTSPTRVVDTRDLTRDLMNVGTMGSRIAPSTVYRVDLGGERGIPTTAKALSVNVTVTAVSTTGSITVWGCGTTPPVKTINFTAGSTIANGVQVKLSSVGELCFSGTTNAHVIVDVNGWWS